MACYLGLLAFGVLGILSNSRAYILILIIFFLAYLAKDIFQMPAFIERFLELALSFLLGVSFWVWRKYIILSPVLAIFLAVIATLATSTPIFYPLMWLAIGYFIFLIGYWKTPQIQGFNILGDYSYGIYIYAWPVQQFCAYFGATTPLINATASLPIVLGLAILSWHIVEHPALKMKKRYQPFGKVLSQQ